ncbi:MAG: multicopper oxidase family protein, partial [Anaerolineae bacterium]
DGSQVGHAYYTKDDGEPRNQATYRYPNTQEGALIWFHDHTLGATRLNVYAGLAGAYLIADPDDGLFGELPELFPLVIQDRMFDTNGELFFPSDSAGGVLWTPNPEHPYWVPEFVGDVIVVNGKSWPFLDVQPKRYTFLFINGSNARTYEMSLTDQVSKNPGPPLWVIGTDGGYLDAPVKIDPAIKGNNKLAIMSGERYWVVVDFSGYEAGVIGPNGQPYSGRWLLRNNAKTPYPAGAAPKGNTVGRIMEFRVGGGPVADTSFDPALPGATLRGGEGQVPEIVRLGTVAPAVTRQLTLNEVMGMPKVTTDPVTGAPSTAYPGGPLEVLVNNTRWAGKRVIGVEDGMYMTEPIDGFSEDYYGNWLSELPHEGDTEIWEIVNLTADAHPIHLHLVQFQLLSRQNYNVNRYNRAYAAAFPGGYDYTMGMDVGAGVVIPAYGPPLDYETGNPRAVGGNPDITPYLQGLANPPLPQEDGWKDTVIMFPGQVTRIAVRWAPTDLATNLDPAELVYPFDPAVLGRGYVWHCHIVDHEDNEMMRPDEVVPQVGALRSYNGGSDY